jgi:hypothetical protein
MITATLLPWVLLAWLLGRRKDLSTHATPVPGAPKPAPAPTPAAQAEQASAPAAAKAPVIVPVSHTTAVQVQPAPWPQVVPAGLPGFPGPSWVPDNPPGAGVVSRASSLIPVLWKHGPGTFKTEQTAGRWITYRATPMGSKKGVVAFKLATEPSVRPVPSIQVGPAEIVTPSAPAAVPASAPARPSAVALSTLRLTSPRMTGPDVVTLQKRLGLSADGVFGSGTHSAVIAYQRTHGLTPDGVVGRQTWASLFGSSA